MKKERRFLTKGSPLLAFYPGIVRFHVFQKLLTFGLVPVFLVEALVVALKTPGPLSDTDDAHSLLAAQRTQSPAGLLPVLAGLLGRDLTMRNPDNAQVRINFLESPL